MTPLRTGLALVAAAFLVTGAAGGSGQPAADRSPGAKASSQPQDIHAALAGDPRFRTLSRGIEAAGLAAVLKGRGPLTLLAPTEEAFEKLGAEALGELFRPENKARLAAMLKYHMISSRLGTAELAAGRALETANGQRVHVAKADGVVRVNDARLVGELVDTGNGVVLPIDAVVVPNDRTLVQHLRGDERFQVFVELLAEADLLKMLAADGPVTVFAPTDAAFESLEPGALDGLRGDRAVLRRVLLNHVVSARRVYADAGSKPTGQTTVSGSVVTVTSQDGVSRVGEARIRGAAIDTSNGVLHAIDAVLMPN